ncbi:MAG: hypothetical protein GVY17_01345 [Cyanobacteria bacterium]|jgi:hypothetical protein|nr:hypothetical protein [Cyanobacteria bacterium GSL.Bin21]
MTTAKVITIHEFSTGIQAQRTADGNWVSQGFTGQYMNVTLDPVPEVVRKAISNRLFAVAEGSSQAEAAMIGREVIENGEAWSVIAVVSKGKDDRGRSASMYRYFLSEGRNQLTPILRWLLNRKKDFVFNPFDYQEIGQPHQADRDKNSPPVDKTDHLIELAEREAPIIISSDDKIAQPLIINSLAIKKAEENGYPIAWAYQVEALEKPRSFQVIYPASAKAEQVLINALATRSTTPAIIDNEQDLTTAVKAIFRKSKLQFESLLTLEDALTNPQITEEYWQSLFNGQGADKALKNGIYSAQMVRLLALQAVLLPKTLPKYIGWLEKRDKNKNEETKKLFIDFQKQFRDLLVRANSESEFPHLKQKIVEGVRFLIPIVVQPPDLLKPIVSLLKPQKGLWGYFYHYQVKSEIERDLNTIPLIVNNRQPDAQLILLEAEPLWEQLFQDIKSTWYGYRISPKPKYLPLAQLFAETAYFNSAALFHHIAWGEVPGQVFDKCSGYGNRSRKQIYGVWVKRHFTLLEQLWNDLVEIGGKIVPVYMFAPLLILTFVVSGVAGGFLLPRTPFLGAVFDPKPEEKTSETNVATPNNSETTTANKTADQKGEQPDNNSQLESQEKSQTNQAEKTDSASGQNSSTTVLSEEEVKNFNNKTRKSIRQIINNDNLFTLKDQSRLSDPKLSDQQNYIDVLRNDIFNNPNLQISIITEDNRPNDKSLQEWQTWKKLWIEEVKDYQREQGSNVIDGIITPNARTHQAIRQKLEERKQKATESSSDFQDPNY